VALFHGHLKKGAFILKVERKSNLPEITKRIDVFRGDV